MEARALTADVVIVGGGLSGLTATWQLHRHGFDVLLLEARRRLGGRVLTISSGGGFFDLGPSWVWHGQPCVAGLLRHFGISTYEQSCEGDLLHQLADGTIHRDSMLKPMEHSLRIHGGIAAMVDALASDVPAGRVRLETAVTGVAVVDGRVRLTTTGPGGEVSLEAAQVALAVPPRLTAALSYHPPLDDVSRQTLEATPTWMAGHAKFLAIYDRPFWRDAGFSGDALSRRGPLAEVHDASPASGGPYALFGFVGIASPARAAMTEDELVQNATAQLVELFGPEADATHGVHLMDWSNEIFTAASTDRSAPDHHPRYGIRIELEDCWRDVLYFIGSETGFENGGLVEGALQQGLSFAATVVRSRQESLQDPVTGTSGEIHAASMGWDWLGS